MSKVVESFQLYTGRESQSTAAARKPRAIGMAVTFTRGLGFVTLQAILLGKAGLIWCHPKSDFQKPQEFECCWGDDVIDLLEAN